MTRCSSNACRQRGVIALATDDSLLAIACALMGITVENPVTPCVASAK